MEKCLSKPGWQRRLQQITERFCDKGATSPEKATTVNELSLPPQFEQAFEKRLSRRGIFVKVNDKYYLSERRLEEIRGRGPEARREMGDRRRKMLLLRVLRLAVGILLLGLFLVNMYSLSSDLRLVVTVTLLVLIGISVVQIYYLTRSMRRPRPTFGL